MTSPESTHLAIELGGVKKAIELMLDQWRRQEDAATQGRRVLHDKFENFKDETTSNMASLGLRIDRVVDQMGQLMTTLQTVEPAVKAFNDEKLRKEGAQRLGARLWAATIGISGAVGWGLHEFFMYIKGHS